MEMTIKDLVAAARMGDQQAMTQLYEDTNRRAYYLAVQLVKDEDQAWDILQDSYVKAFESLDSLADPAKFQGWLNMIVTNKSKDYLRKKKPLLFSQLASEDDEEANVDFEDESGQFSPEATVDYSETKRLVQEMIDDLSDDQRMAIVLHYMEYCSVKQIAEIMGCSEGTVKSRLNYGRKAIKEKVLVLEKQGTKLYCMPLVPFLYWLFQQQAQSFLFPWEAAALASGAGFAQAGAASASAGAGEGAGAAGSAGNAGVSGISGSAGSAAGSGSAGSGMGAAGQAAGSMGASGAAAGSTGAGSMGASAASAAGKAGLTLFGKAIGVKGVAIAASVCVVAGAGAAGGLYAASRLTSSQPAVEAVEGQEADAVGDTSGAEDAGAVGYVLTDEERQALEAIYDAAESGDYERVYETFRPAFMTLYRLEREHFPDQFIIFDGEDLSAELEGHKLAVRTISRYVTRGDHEGEIRYSVIGYLGDFADGVPDGELLSFSCTYESWRETIPSNYMEISLAAYENGGLSGEISGECLYEGDNGIARDYTIAGSYDTEGNPDGEFSVSASIDWLNTSTSGYVTENWEELEDSMFSFHGTIIENSEVYEAYQDLSSAEREAATEEWGDFFGLIYNQQLLFVDDSRQFAMNSGDISTMAYDMVMWSGNASQHDEGTENILPDGTTLVSEDGDSQEESGDAQSEEKDADLSDSLEGDPALMGPYNAAMAYPQFEWDPDDIWSTVTAWHMSGSTMGSAWGEQDAEFIDRGDYFEVTNAAISAPYILPEEVISQMAPGFSFTVSIPDQNGNESSETLTVIGPDGDGGYEMSSYGDGEADCYLEVREDGTGLIRSYDDDAVFRGTIYSGSLYFAKDCTVYGVSTIQTEQGSGSSVPFEEYVTEEQPYIEAQADGTITGFEAGNRGNYISVQGIPVFDPATGLIVEYQEIHIP